MSPRSPLNQNTMVVALMAALTAYVPFETLATAWLLVCAFLFILDPLPPTTRVISMISVVIVAVLARFNNTLKEEREIEDQKSSGSFAPSRGKNAVADVAAVRRNNKEE